MDVSLNPFRWPGEPGRVALCPHSFSLLRWSRWRPICGNIITIGGCSLGSARFWSLCTRMILRCICRNLDILLTEVVRFGTFSGIVMNWSKSVVLPLTRHTARFPSRYPVEWAEGPVRYLGVWLSCDVETLWLANYGRLVAWLEDRLEMWRSLPLSLTGRIDIAKMVVLPKFLYLFVNLPLMLPRSFLRRLRSALVWAAQDCVGEADAAI
ncbi:hypothetical protein NDU88_007027 [Pleurodeles waltl]|uniref:Uncharacterized protein n=1 Tax=Pleurodeles waltl TaxID=8319 RepID=A0AAV7VT89_PLEWA|nr:hypothetical protein NDU88_007027 [Pleurodeles waltl]